MECFLAEKYFFRFGGSLTFGLAHKCVQKQAWKTVSVGNFVWIKFGSLVKVCERETKKLVIEILTIHTVKGHVYTFFELCFELFQDKVTQFNVSLLEVEIVNDNVEVSRRESIFEFNLGCV